MQLNWFNHIQPNPFSFTGILTGPDGSCIHFNSPLMTSKSTSSECRMFGLLLSILIPPKSSRGNLIRCKVASTPSSLPFSNDLKVRGGFNPLCSTAEWRGSQLGYLPSASAYWHVARLEAAQSTVRASEVHPYSK